MTQYPMSDSSWSDSYRELIDEDPPAGWVAGVDKHNATTFLHADGPTNDDGQRRTIDICPCPDRPGWKTRGGQNYGQEYPILAIGVSRKAAIRAAFDEMEAVNDGSPTAGDPEQRRPALKPGFFDDSVATASTETPTDTGSQSASGQISLDEWSR